jgi:hypothetical protein
MFIHSIAWSVAISFPVSYLVSYLLWRIDPGKSWSRDLLKSSRFLIDDDDVDNYLTFILQFITLQVWFDLI